MTARTFVGFTVGAVVFWIGVWCLLALLASVVPAVPK